AMAMQNSYMCYAHRTDDVPTVIENDMFLIDNLDTHEAIQKAFCDVAARLACNHIDLKRAELLITLLRAASRNLREAAAARRQALREAAIAQPATESGAPHLDSERWVPPNPADLLQNCHPERSSASAPNAVEGPAVASHTATAESAIPTKAARTAASKYPEDGTPTNNEARTTDNESVTLNAVAAPSPSRAKARRERHEVRLNAVAQPASTPRHQRREALRLRRICQQLAGVDVEVPSVQRQRARFHPFAYPR